MNLKKGLMVSMLLTLTAGAAYAGASDARYQVNYRINGLVKAAPACSDPLQAEVGAVSDRFCGHIGKQMLRGPSSQWLFYADDAEPGPWLGAACTLAPKVDLWNMIRLVPLDVSGIQPSVIYWAREQYSSTSGTYVTTNGISNSGMGWNSIRNTRCVEPM